jgi:hypothetical protein
VKKNKRKKSDSDSVVAFLFVDLAASWALPKL